MVQTLSRRSVILSGGMAAVCPPIRTIPTVIAGAIRWDAWDAAGSNVLDAVEQSLSPGDYMARAPFCADVSPAAKLGFAACASQATMDAEIAYAARAGLSYWAYCWYSASDPMMNAWRLHRSSKHRDDVKWCLLLQFSAMGGTAKFADVIDTYVGYFKQKNYQRVLAERPLVYIYVDSTARLATDWLGSWDVFGAALDRLRKACISGAVPPPYVVIMNGGAAAARDIMTRTGADAISNYMGPVPRGQPASYEALDASVQAYWASQAATGASVVPICMTGWDTRPRKQHPPFWQKNQQANVGMEQYVAAGTPEQIAAHVRAGAVFIGKHPTSCPSRSLLIYSWDECDEGGSALIPSYDARGPNSAILNAVGRVLGEINCLT